MIDGKNTQHAGLWPRHISRSQARDTGLAMVLLCLIGFWVSGDARWTAGAGFLLVLDMVAPRVFTPLGHLWFGLANLLGSVVSRVLMAASFYLVVTPVGLVRRALGRDTLKLRQFKNSDDSVFVVRDHTYSKTDVEQPF